MKRSKLFMAIAGLSGAIRRTFAGLDEQWGLHQVVTLEAQGPSRGRALFSYHIKGFLTRPDDPILMTHTHYWQSVRMAGILAELGYTVDVIDYRNTSFQPTKDYALFVDVRHNMERLAPGLGKDCLKIFHIDTAHLLASNAGEARRLLDLLMRRGINLKAMRYEPPHRGIETADCATGNVGSFSLSTFRYAGKPIQPVPAPVAHTHDFPDGKDWENCRNRFLWFGSSGLVHKGLDLVLEAFAGMPDCHLTVCAPIDGEPDFKHAFHRELYQTPNIETHGFVHNGGETFRLIVSQCAALIYPSCSEGLSTSTIECMHAGLIPIVTPETGVPVEDFGFEISPCTPERIREIAREVTEMPPYELKRRSRCGWEFARAHHTRDQFAETYRKAITRFIDGHQAGGFPKA